MLRVVPDEEGLLDMLFWVVAPSKVDPRKVEPSTTALIGEWGG
jgi:hypothetical protein